LISEGVKVTIIDLTPEDEVGIYRKRPVTISAFQWQAQDISKWPSWLKDKNPTVRVEENRYDKLELPTLEGTITASFGDYVIQGVAGEVYPCKPDIFLATYERCDERMTDA
jgi:hypothetical protein